MPLYDYQCQKCKEITEVRHGFDDAHTEPCPKCAGPLTRLFNPAGIVFKGSGFYVNDSRKSEAKSESKSESKPESKSESKPESSPAPSSSPSKESAA
ncbi:MAG: FmdB family zinc ribbon protein [Candidatus Baltobacteraceae bacterium]